MPGRKFTENEWLTKKSTRTDGKLHLSDVGKRSSTSRGECFLSAAEAREKLIREIGNGSTERLRQTWQAICSMMVLVCPIMAPVSGFHTAAVPFDSCVQLSTW